MGVPLIQYMHQGRRKEQELFIEETRKNVFFETYTFYGPIMRDYSMDETQ